MRYLIIGAGGTGGFMAANMAEAGLDVAVIARGEHLRQIRAQGLGLETPERGEYTVCVKACSMEEYLGTDRGDGGAKVFDGQAPDVIFVCVKGYSLKEAVSFIRQAAGEKTIVIPVLNIYGTGGRIQEKLPEILVTDGCIYISANISSPGHLKRHGDVFRVVFGLRRGQKAEESQRERLGAVEADLRKAGIEGILSENIERDALLKFSYVSPQAGCGLYCHAEAGAIQKDDGMRGFFIQLVREVDAVAKAMGIDFGEDIVRRNLAILDALKPTASTSMQRDLEKGDQSEIDGLIYEVVRLGEKYGVDVPGYRKISEKYQGIYR